MAEYLCPSEGFGAARENVHVPYHQQARGRHVASDANHPLVIANLSVHNSEDCIEIFPPCSKCVRE